MVNIPHFHVPALFRTPRFKLAMIGVLVLALAWVAFIIFQYQLTKKPVTDLPGMPPVGQVIPRTPPSFVQAVYGPDDAHLASPLGVAISPRGDFIYATQSVGMRSTVAFDRAGNPLFQFAPSDTGPGGRLPTYVAVAPNGNVYVSDRLRGVIDIYTAQGADAGTFQPAERPRAPLGLAFDRAGNLYVTDLATDEHRLLVYDPAGNLKLKLGTAGSEPGQFSYPNCVAVDGRGNIYVADSNNGRVQIFTADGAPLAIIGAGGRGTLGNPRGLAIDESNRLFIADSTGQSLEVWDVSELKVPKRLYVVGSQGIDDGQFNYPNGVATDPSGRIYVTDRENNRVLVWSY